MRLTNLRIENFRLLRDIELGLEDRTTLIVGRNNSGKTSIAEIFRRLLSEKTLSFRLEDFSLGCHEQFWNAFAAFSAGAEVSDVLNLLPSIRVTLDISYDVNSPDLGPLGDCIIDLDPECKHARLVLTFAPVPNATAMLFADLPLPQEGMANART